VGEQRARICVLVLAPGRRGPHQRDLRESHTDGAFLFPQMTLSHALRKEMGEDQWSPNFVDYLFLAFNTSTAFSPTDVPVLSRWAKALMMVQASIALATLAVLAARASISLKRDLRGLAHANYPLIPGLSLKRMGSRICI